MRPILCLLVIALGAIAYVLFRLGLAGPAIAIANGALSQALHVTATLIHPPAKEKKD